MSSGFTLQRFLSKKGIGECKLFLTVAGETTAWCPEEEEADTYCCWWARVKDEQDRGCRVRRYTRFFSIKNSWCRREKILFRQRSCESLGLMLVCSVSIELAEKNGDDGESDTTAAVSGSSFFKRDFLKFFWMEMVFELLSGVLIVICSKYLKRVH